MKRLLLISLFVLPWFIPLTVKSTHIVGGEIYYEQLTGDVYKITLIVYRDCFNGIPGFDDPGFIAVFDSAYNRIKNIEIAAPIPDTVPIENFDSCTKIGQLCYEVATYVIVDTLPPIKGGYHLVYDRCCWNYSVINIVLPDESGLTVLTKIPDTAIAHANSSAIFKNRTPVFFCVNQFFEFDHSATDIDGDSLTYELFTPYNSSRVFQSQLAPLKGPYNELIYMPGFSYTNMLGSKVPLAIDEFSGLLTVTHSNQVGQYVFGVRVKEWRNGIFIGKSERTYQINSQQCQRFTVANFSSPINQCGDSVVSFDNKSDSAMAFLWHYGDVGSDDSISNNKTPTHSYSGFGSYSATLIAYSYEGDECNDTLVGQVNLYPDLEGQFVWEDDKCSNFVQFNDLTQSPFGAINKWQWDFGDGKGDNTKDPYHKFNLDDIPKTYLVSLLVENENGCKDSVSLMYTGENRKYRINSIEATKYLIYPRDDSTLLSADADSAVSYSWTPDQGLSSPKNKSTFAKSTVPTSFKLIARDGRGCEAEERIEIDVYKYSCGETSVFIPNAFSPNGDGENDYLRIRGEEISSLDISVYNRWGQLVFQSADVNMINNPSLGWNGDFNGERQDPGVYVFTAEITCSDKRSFTKKGNVTLIR